MRETMLYNPQVRRLRLQGCRESRRSPGTPGLHLPGRGTGTPRCKERLTSRDPTPDDLNHRPQAVHRNPVPILRRPQETQRPLQCCAQPRPHGETALLTTTFSRYISLLPPTGQSSRLHYQPWTNHLFAVLNNFFPLFDGGRGER